MIEITPNSPLFEIIQHMPIVMVVYTVTMCAWFLNKEIRQHGLKAFQRKEWR